MMNLMLDLITFSFLQSHRGTSNSLIKVQDILVQF